MKTEEALERLAFIKSLYNVGVDQSRKPEPYCWTSVLTFHDSVELFLALASEYLDLGKRLGKIDFMEYWPLLSSELMKKGRSELAQKISMERLNKARVDFKHYGNSPSRSNIEDFRASVTNFFEENTPLVFGSEFSNISLIELVECQAVKKSLRETEENLKKGNIDDALDLVAVAFAQLIDDYEDRKKDAFGRSPFFFGESMTFMDSSSLGVEGQLESFVDAVRHSIEAIQQSVKILSLGLDYRRYARFRLVTPVVVLRSHDKGKWKYNIQRIRLDIKRPLTADDVRYCIDFVIESAIILQEFDFEIEQIRHPTLSDLA